MRKESETVRVPEVLETVIWIMRKESANSRKSGKVFF
jgi:hypothetical protein